MGCQNIFLIRQRSAINIKTDLETINAIDGNTRWTIPRARLTFQTAALKVFCYCQVSTYWMHLGHRQPRFRKEKSHSGGRPPSDLQISKLGLLELPIWEPQVPYTSFSNYTLRNSNLTLPRWNPKRSNYKTIIEFDINSQSCSLHRNTWIIQLKLAIVTLETPSVESQKQLYLIFISVPTC